LERVIEPRPGWRPIDLRELYRYRDLLWFNTWRGIRARYAQSSLGVGWAVAQPVISMLIYTLIFGYVSRIQLTEGVPYAVCVFCGIVPWSFFAGSLTCAANSLILNAAMLTKIYFPRPILPLSEVLARSVDLVISFVLLLLMIAGFGLVPRPLALIMIPLMSVVMAMASLGAGLWLSALAVHYRDVAYGLTFFVQVGFFLTPVVYDVSAIPARLRLVFGLNPMVGVIATYRAVLLGVQPVPWMLVGESIVVSIVLLVTGAFYFRRAERLFADVV